MDIRLTLTDDHRRSNRPCKCMFSIPVAAYKQEKPLKEGQKKEKRKRRGMELEEQKRIYIGCQS